MSTLNSQIESLAKNFAAQVLRSIRSASLEDTLGHAPAAQASKTAPSAPTKRSSPKRRGRLPRRNADQIQSQLASVVALLKKNPKGLRSEAIREALKLDRREIPRILAEGLKGKVLGKPGAKRATTYRA